MTTRNLRVSLLVLLVASLAATAFATAPAGAQTGSAGRTIEIEAWDSGGEFYFTLAGSTEKNPTLTVDAGETVTFHVVNKGTMIHNFHILAPVNKKVPAENNVFLNPGEEGNLTVTIPTTAATLNYQCDPHSFQMKGTLSVQGANTGGNNSEPKNESPGFDVLAALGAAAAVVFLARRK